MGPLEIDVPCLTLSLLYSIVVAILVARGQLHYESPIERYWPEFGGSQGRSCLTLADVMRHEGGIPVLDPPLQCADLKDYDRLATKLVKATPSYSSQDGVRVYHGLTRGISDHSPSYLLS
jgi:CubicO group peptidase (beta-lactamase class C family)